MKEARSRIDRDDALSLVASLPIAVAIFDPGMRFLTWSRRWADDFGGEIGVSLGDYLRGMDMNWHAVHARCLSGATESGAADPFIDREGSTRFLSWTMNPWHDAAGEIGGTVLLVDFATGASRVPVSPRSREEFLGLALEASGNCMYAHYFVPDSELFCTPSLSRLLGYERSYFPSGDRFQDWLRERIHPADRPAVQRAFEAFMGGYRTRFSLDYRFQKKSGDWLWVHEECLAPNRALSGRARLVVGLLSDISTRKQTETRDVGSRWETLATIAGGIAHDFNNALAVIWSQVDRQALVSDDPRILETVEKITGACSYARDLVRQIISVSRQTEEENRPCDLVAALAETRRFLATQFPDSIRTSYDIPPHPVWVQSTPSKLIQVLMNLMCNAADAMYEGGGELQVRIAQEESLPGEVHLSVRDTGSGIAAENLPRIFEPFFTTRRAEGGSGMGLAVVHGIVKGMGGAIEVESEAQQGTVFRVRLPGVRDAPGVVPASRDRPQSGTGETILVVEDNKAFLESLAEILDLLNYEPVGHSDPHRALADFRSRPAEFALLLTDVRMSGMAGQELARARRVLRPELPVLLCSGYAERTRADDEFPIVMKPVSATDLAARIGELLEPTRRD